MINVKNLNKTYDRYTKNANHVLHDISFELPSTGFVCILGQSGCGKTSLLNAIGGLDNFDNGSIGTENVKAEKYGTKQMEAERNENFGYIFQNYYLLQNHSVAYNIYLGMHSLKISHKEKLERIKEVLKEVDMANYGKRIVGELSGGQQQRVAIARALARRPRIIFADEPTGNLDEANTMNICTLLRRISKTSLVVMVTHEENIAYFFADRIIRMKDGNIISDEADWQRNGMSVASKNVVYTGDLQDEKAELGNDITIRVLSEDSSQPTDITIVALKDRIVIKTSDKRLINCSNGNDEIRIIEGAKPVLSLETIDRQDETEVEKPQETPSDPKAEKHKQFGMKFKEIFNLARKKDPKRIAIRVFLVVLAVLMIINVGDFARIAEIKPSEFAHTDSNVLSVRFLREDGIDAELFALKDLSIEAIKYLKSQGLDFDVIPAPSDQPNYKEETFLQTGSCKVEVAEYCTVFLERFNSSNLIFGRIPEKMDEVVVDKLVLERTMEEKGILQNSIPNVQYFLGKSFTYSRGREIKIVGISDVGSPNIYMSKSLALNLGNFIGTPIATLDEFVTLYLDVEIDVDALKTLAINECLYVGQTIAVEYRNPVGSTVRLNNRLELTVAANYVYRPTTINIVVSDAGREEMLNNCVEEYINVYCADKQAFKNVVANGLPQQFDNKLKLAITDNSQLEREEYTKMVRERVNARVIVTVTVAFLLLVMLYLLQRSVIRSRIELVSVYRLLGVPKRELVDMFMAESALLLLVFVIPFALATWGVVALLAYLGIAANVFSLTWYWVLAAIGFVSVYFELVTVLPLVALINRPPAKLATKYDF